MNFSDYKVWEPIIQVGLIMGLVLFANILRRKIKFIRNSLIPTSVIAGIIILLLRLNKDFSSILNKNLLEGITYHFLALGFIAIALKVKADKKLKDTVIVETGAITVSTYLIQAIVGLIVTILLAFTFNKGLLYASGLILPLGFGQGPGQALNFGTIYENQFNFVGGADFGLAIAGIGFLVACLVGVLYLNILRKKGKITVVDETEKYIDNYEVSATDEIPMTESIDKITIQIALILFSYFIAYLLIYGLSYLATTFLGNFGTNTVKPLLWGFNFVFGSVVAVIVGAVLRFLRRKEIMNRQYPNNFLLNRLGGFLFDIMIVASLGAIEIKMLESLILPIILLTIVGTISTFVYLKIICPIVYPNYTYQGFFALFGMLTGTASTGMILLREVDYNYESPMATNLVLQNFPAILFGFPLMLLLAFAPHGLMQSLITLGILTFMFIAFNFLILKLNKRREEVKSH
ncbi:MAG TPA: sodium:glutamate symporter [Acholeplasmataceae bacterium]|nr:sodium:glutamate symporter [Acholeplasmataceae bacterium]